MPSGVNMSTNSLKVSDTTETEFFKLIFFQSDQKYCCADLWSVSEPLACLLSISVLLRGFLGIKVTPLFAVHNFRNK